MSSNQDEKLAKALKSLSAQSSKAGYEAVEDFKDKISMKQLGAISYYTFHFLAGIMKRKTKVLFLNGIEIYADTKLDRINFYLEHAKRKGFLIDDIKEKTLYLTPAQFSKMQDKYSEIWAEIDQHLNAGKR